jgi:hypothetical protein
MAHPYQHEQQLPHDGGRHHPGLYDGRLQVYPSQRLADVRSVGHPGWGLVGGSTGPVGLREGDNHPMAGRIA